MKEQKTFLDALYTPTQTVEWLSMGYIGNAENPCGWMIRDKENNTIDYDKSEGVIYKRFRKLLEKELQEQRNLREQELLGEEEPSPFRRTSKRQ